MRNSIQLTIAAAALLAASSPALAQSPQRCPEGRTSTGQCVNPDLAQDLRTTTFVLSQPKLSMTNPPVMPSQDGQYDVPRDHHEIRNLHGYPPVTSAYGRTITVTTPILITPFFTTVTINTGPAP